MCFVLSTFLSWQYRKFSLSTTRTPAEVSGGCSSISKVSSVSPWRTSKYSCRHLQTSSAHDLERTYQMLQKQVFRVSAPVASPLTSGVSYCNGLFFRRFLTDISRVKPFSNYTNTDTTVLVAALFMPFESKNTMVQLFPQQRAFLYFLTCGTILGTRLGEVLMQSRTGLYEECYLD